MTKAKRAKAPAPPKPELPPPSEAKQAEIDRLKARFDGLPHRPRSTVTVSKMAGGGNKAEISQADDEHMEMYAAASFVAVGSRSHSFLNMLLNQIGEAVKGGLSETEKYNANSAILLAVEPQNELEALLAAQMIAAHEGAMSMSAKMRHADMLPQFQAYSGLANKFMRTFAVQMETLAKIRRGGEQIVKHVHVYDGGQAVVANTINQHRGVGGALKDGGQSDATNAIAGSAALPCPDEAGHLVPVPGSERPAAMQDARRDESGGAEGQQERLEARP